MARVSVSTTKPINLEQLAGEMGTDQLFGPGLDELASANPKDIVADGVTQTALQTAIDAHTADTEYRPPGPEKDWRTKLQAEIDAISVALADSGTNWTTAAIIKRLARNQLRILKWIRDQQMDAGL